MSKNLRLVTADPISPARERLADAIARRDRIAKEIIALNAAVERNEDESIASRAAIEQATVALDVAQRNRGAMLVAAATGKIPDAGADINACKAALLGLEAKHAEIRETRDALQAAQQEFKQKNAMASGQVDDAVRDVLTSDPFLAALLEKFEKAKSEYHRLLQVLDLLQSMHLVPRDSNVWRAPPTYDLLAGFMESMRHLTVDASAPLPAP